MRLFVRNFFIPGSTANVVGTLLLVSVAVVGIFFSWACDAPPSSDRDEYVDKSNRRYWREKQENPQKSNFGSLIPPGATDFKRLDEYWYTYEFEGNKYLVHAFAGYRDQLSFDSVLVPRK